MTAIKAYICQSRIASLTKNFFFSFCKFSSKIFTSVMLTRKKKRVYNRILDFYIIRISLKKFSHSNIYEIFKNQLLSLVLKLLYIFLFILL